jgi:hypothetical protein
MYTVFLGRALQTVNPPADSVGGSQLADSAISGQTALGAEPADTDEFLVSDAGTLKRMDYSYIKSAAGVLQVKQTQITDTGSRAALSWGIFDSDMTVVITPTLSTSKMLVSFDIPCATTGYAWLRIVRTVSAADTVIAVGDQVGSNRWATTTGNAYGLDGSETKQMSGCWLDNPATTSEITYSIQATATGTVYFGRPYVDADNTNTGRSASTITVMEIAVGVL